MKNGRSHERFDGILPIGFIDARVVICNITSDAQSCKSYAVAAIRVLVTRT